MDAQMYLRKNTSVMVRAKYNSQETARNPESIYGVSNLNPFEAVKTRNLLNRRQTCNEQVVHWTAMLRNTEALMLLEVEVKRTGADDMTVGAPPTNGDRERENTSTIVK